MASRIQQAAAADAARLRAVQIAAVMTLLEHDAEDCAPILFAPLHRSVMTAHKGRKVVT